MSLFQRLILFTQTFLVFAISEASAEQSLSTMPGRQEHIYNLPFQTEYQRLDPVKDGWSSEALQTTALKNLKKLFDSSLNPTAASKVSDLLSEDFGSTALDPTTELVFKDANLHVYQAENLANLATAYSKPQFPSLLRRMSQTAAGPKSRKKFKIISTELAENLFNTKILFEAFTRSDKGSSQVNAEWDARWRIEETDDLKLQRLALRKYQTVEFKGTSGTLFVDATRSVFSAGAILDEQLQFGVEHWRHRLERAVSPTLVAANGLAIGDVNGDGLEDVFVPQDRNIPDLLLLQEPDGTVRNAATESGLNSLAVSSSALLLDLDNDGDSDLVLGGEGSIRFFANNGQGEFAMRNRLEFPSRVESMAAADYDQDGWVDLYACGHTQSTQDQSESVLGIPIPVFDAQNGQPNLLVRNLGAWQFLDATRQAGLMSNNNRFSYAAAWEDYDNDGDQDLYVANDFGRNNLYRNDDGKFQDVAAQAGVEDIASGMSVAWADYNQDGWMDLYVGNMFSSAGNRLTYQRRYQIGEGRDHVDKLQRMARGNTLFINQGDGHFTDETLHSGTSMGRWAWSSVFADVNNDGREDLLIANGFVTNSRLDDL